MTSPLLIILATLFLIFTIYLLLEAKLEDRRFIHEFGEQYREYQQRVLMFLPIPPRKS